jgi:hypothetical protein
MQSLYSIKSCPAYLVRYILFLVEGGGGHSKQTASKKGVQRESKRVDNIMNKMLSIVQRVTWMGWWRCKL